MRRTDGDSLNPQLLLGPFKAQAVDTFDPALSLVILQVNNAFNCCRRMQSKRSTIQPSQSTQSNQSTGHGLRTISVKARPCTAVPGIHGGEQMHNLSPATPPLPGGPAPYARPAQSGIPG